MTNITQHILICAMMLVESGGNPLNNNSAEDALGILQIRPIFLEDCNRIMGRAVWEPNDRYSVTESIMMTEEYFRYYGAAYIRETGKEPTPEVLARMFNGGPDGWKEDCTLPYWEKVNKQIKKFFEVRDTPDQMIGVVVR